MGKLATICERLGVTLYRNHEHTDPNEGVVAGYDVFLGTFDSPTEEITATLHELGHVVTGKLIQDRYWSKVSDPDFWYYYRYYQEYQAWRWARRTARLYQLPFDLQYAVNRLGTYARSNEEWTRPTDFVALSLQPHCTPLSVHKHYLNVLNRHTTKGTT